MILCIQNKTTQCTEYNIYEQKSVFSLTSFRTKHRINIHTSLFSFFLFFLHEMVLAKLMCSKWHYAFSQRFTSKLSNSYQRQERSLYQDRKKNPLALCFKWQEGLWERQGKTLFEEWMWGRGKFLSSPSRTWKLLSDTITLSRWRTWNVQGLTEKYSQTSQSKTFPFSLLRWETL